MNGAMAFFPSSFLFPWAPPNFLPGSCLHTHTPPVLFFLLFCCCFFSPLPSRHGTARHTAPTKTHSTNTKERHHHCHRHHHHLHHHQSVQHALGKKTRFLIPRNLERTKNGAGATHGGFLYIHQGGMVLFCPIFYPIISSLFFRDRISLFYYTPPL
jgi:hypothetical protein